MRSALLWLLALAFLLPTIAADGQVSTDSAHAIPFRLIHGYSIVVQGVIGSRKCNMLVDTGANPTIIDSHIAADLGLSGTDAVMALMNGPVHFQKVTLPALQLGPLGRENFMVLVRDLKSMSREVGTPIDAVVGMDVLAASNFTIDYQHKKLIFGGPPDTNADELNFDSGPPFMVVNARIGDESRRLLVDTGTSTIVLFESMAHGDLHQARVSTRKGRNIAGNFATEEVLLPDVRLSKTHLSSRRAFLVHDQQGWGQTFDGLLGPTAVGLTRVTFDFKAQKLRWKH